MAEHIAQRLVDALHAGTPAQAGCRVNHARGVLVEGRFQPFDEARLLCRASTFAGPDRAMVARFSSSTGDPCIAEDDPTANPRGLAVAIGELFVLVGHSMETFPARTPEEFLDFVAALNARAEDPARLDEHLRDHASARDFEGTRHSSPLSFAALRYHMLHTFCLEGTDGRITEGRLSIRAIDAGDEDLASTVTGEDGLTVELKSRLASRPLELLLMFAPIGDHDARDDIATPWSARELVSLGRLIIERVAADQALQRVLIFDPSRLPDGVSFSGDAMIEARIHAYRLAARSRIGLSSGGEQIKDE